MIIVVCLSCKRGLRIMPVRALVSDMEQLDMLVGRNSEFWPDKFPCPFCDQKATGMLEHEAAAEGLQRLTLQDLTAEEAFAAFNGVGLPEETACGLATVSELLKGTPVRRVVGTNVMGKDRAIIDYLELWDGTRIYFGAGAEGACVYRIRPPFSYTTRALEVVDV